MLKSWLAGETAECYRRSQSRGGTLRGRRTRRRKHVETLGGIEMLSKRKLLVACALGLAATLGYAVFAVASDGPELSGPQTIRVKAIGGHATVLPLNPNKHSFFGNEFVINGPLYDWAGTTRVGRIHA